MGLSIYCSIWLGATDSAEELLFRWDDGYALTWSNWELHQPYSGNSKDCLIRKYSGKWDDADCGATYPFYCENVTDDQTTCVQPTPPPGGQLLYHVNPHPFLLIMANCHNILMGRILRPPRGSMKLISSKLTSPVSFASGL